MDRNGRPGDMDSNRGVNTLTVAAVIKRCFWPVDLRQRVSCRNAPVFVGFRREDRHVVERLRASTYLRGGATATVTNPALSKARRTVPSAFASSTKRAAQSPVAGWFFGT